MLWYSHVKDVTWRKTNIICLLKWEKANFVPKAAARMEFGLYQYYMLMHTLYALHWKKIFILLSTVK